MKKTAAPPRQKKPAPQADEPETIGEGSPVYATTVRGTRVLSGHVVAAEEGLAAEVHIDQGATDGTTSRSVGELHDPAPEARKPRGSLAARLLKGELKRSQERAELLSEGKASVSFEQPLPPALGGIRQLEVSEVLASSTNRPAGDLDELTESVRRLGILQPILVRPHPEDEARFQVVAGHRRLEAARRAGLAVVPALVRELDDRQALEVQLVENLQRKDLHPLEEADGYRLLIDRHGYTAETLALRIGKSKGYVYGRLKLGELGPRARKLFEAGKLDASVALLVARVPGDKLQTEAAETLIGESRFGDPISYRRAAELVQRRFMLELAAAPFDRKDAELVPAAGACGPCPKRTGNAPDLFGDVKGKDVCTDPACFTLKKDADWARRAAAAKAEGRAVLEGKAGAKAIAHGSDWVNVDQARHDLGEKSARRVLKSELPPPALVRDEYDGSVREMVRASELEAALKRAGVSRKKLEKTYADRGAQRRQAAKNRAKKLVGRALVAACLERAVTKDHAALWPIVQAFAWRVSGFDVLLELAQRRELVNPRNDPRGGLEEQLEKLPTKEREGARRELVLEAMLAHGIANGYSSQLAHEPLETAARVLKLDLKRVAAAALREQKAKKKARPARAEKAPRAPKAKRARARRGKT